MVTKAGTRIYEVGPRHTLYLKKELVNDSAFPFKVKQMLIVKIEGQRLIIEEVERQHGES